MTGQYYAIIRAWSQLLGGVTLGLGILISVFTLTMEQDAARAIFTVSFPLAILGALILFIGNWTNRKT